MLNGKRSGKDSKGGGKIGQKVKGGHDLWWGGFGPAL